MNRFLIINIYDILLSDRKSESTRAGGRALTPALSFPIKFYA